ncbi:SDR family oxidoreductase [Citricoccus sp. SGAir0253]|uniref:coniferyl-alcohol dehydrogenase n=1 Tax=Citricoccus sp. SGAir0253 TaxID=2567881 RepID=UPI0010CCF997|nr:coniferyl-alcohol dehydrogenase [Citricoccus sp. SGAir0253]QCU77178.1 SDR family oxidoreductase [Citricoccus sp. SGAir0253]
MNLDGQTLVVTGVASGIGAATAALLQRGSATVVGVDRNIPDAFAGTFVQGDLSTPEGVAAVADQVPAGIHGLLNIAGVPGTAPWQTVLAVNVFGVRDLTRLLLPKIADGGAVVNLASNVAAGWAERREEVARFVQAADAAEAIAAVADDPEVTGNSYRFSKECVRWLTQVQASENLGRVRVNSVSPGPVQTPILEDFKKDHGREKVEGAVSLLGRAGQPEDIAAAIAFLLSPQAAWLNGTDLCVDGGLLAHRSVTAMAPAAA